MLDWNALAVLLSIVTLAWRLGSMARGINSRLDAIAETNTRQESSLESLHRSMITLWHGHRVLRKRLAAVEEAAGVTPPGGDADERRHLRTDSPHPRGPRRPHG